MQDLLAKNLPSDDSSDDEDYVPTEAELKEDQDKKSFKKGARFRLDKKTPEEIISEMKTQWEESIKQKKAQNEQIENLNIKELLDKVNKDRPAPTMIKFAGKTFNLSEADDYKLFEGPEKSPQPAETTIAVEKDSSQQADSNSELVIPPVVEPKEVTMGQKFEYLKSLLKTIDAKNINSMTKSRYDWKDYTKKENMEKQFNENRKDGYLEKKMFLEKSKQEEKEYIKSRKKVKTS